MAFITSAMILVLFMVLNEGQSNDDFLFGGDKAVVIGPSNTQIIWANINKHSGEMVLESQPLPGPIDDLKAFAYDTLHITFIFSGGDPNKLFSYNRKMHKFDIVADDVVDVTSMDTGEHGI